MPRAAMLLALAASALAAPVPPGHDLRGVPVPKGTVLMLTEVRESRDDGDKSSSFEKHRVELRRVDGRRATGQRVEFLQHSTITVEGGVKTVHASSLEGQAATMDFTKGAWVKALERGMGHDLSDVRPWCANDVFFPTRRVKVGDRWKASVDELKAHWKERFEFRLDEAEAAARFEAVEDHGGEPCAVVRIELRFAGRLGDGAGRLEQTTRYLVRRSLRTGLDRKVTIDLEVRYTDAGGNAGPPSRHRIERTVSVEKTP